jgi:Recombinational DNA repair ATPase (RecF pathway)
MKINRIRLENFKIHKNLEINFDEKNIIIGENGVGKSSIFHAILFGYLEKILYPV